MRSKGWLAGVWPNAGTRTSRAPHEHSSRRRSPSNTSPHGRDSEPVTIPGGRCGIGAHSTVGAVVPDEVFEVGKVLGLAIHGRNL